MFVVHVTAGKTGHLGQDRRKEMRESGKVNLDVQRYVWRVEDQCSSSVSSWTEDSYVIFKK